MKKKLFRSFIVSLFVFTLFISVSNAEIVANTDYTYNVGGNPSTSSRKIETDFSNSGYTNTSVQVLLSEYLEDFDESHIIEVCNIFKANGYGNYSYYYYSGSGIQMNFYSDNTDVAISMNDENNPNYIWFDSSNQRQITLNESGVFNYKSLYYSTRNGLLRGSLSTSYPTGYNVVQPLKKFELVADKKWQWDGVSYYTQSVPEPEVPVGPEFITELTDDEIADVVENFSNSTYWKNRNSNYTGFFIQRNELNGNYAVMVVPDHLIRNKFVEGIYIPANASSSNYSVLDYDTYSIGHIKTGVPQLPWNQWIESFKLYGSSDGINFEYAGEMLASDYMKYRIPMTTPVIYSNFTIPFKTLIGDTTNSFDEIIDSFTEETDYNFSNLVNSETGESYEFDDVPVEDNPIIRALREFFTDLTGYLSSAFEFVINKIFNFSEYLLNEFGENVFTLLFAIVIEAFSALVAGISLLVRFAGFVLTLVAIPADSSLFNVLVDGSAWGTHFIEGLNFLKGLSWNNLNLWTFFECFVAALEVIWTVKIVRRHYSQVV